MSSSTHIPNHVGCMKIVASEAIGDSVPVFDVRSRIRESPPKFRFLPVGKDLNPPFGETPTAFNNSHASEDTLAVSGLVKYQDEIDLIADVDLLKKLFSTPYTNAGLSLNVQRIGDTLVLKPTPGPAEVEVDVDEGCKTQVDESLFHNFATQSLRMVSSCGCPPTKKPKSKIKPSGEEYRGGLFVCHLDIFRMLVGSEQQLFSNDKDLDVNLQLWDVSKEVPWLEAWLHNEMTNVPLLGLCLHEKGIVKQYKFYQTSDICSPTVRQDVVLQHAHDVLTFLQSNCKEDPGTYWLYRSSGEDAMYLYDLSLNHTTSDDEDDNGLPSKMRIETLFSLGKRLHKLASSVVADDPIRCATFLRKCLNILVEQEHMVVRANAHELFARLLLKNDNEDIYSEFLDNVSGDVMIEFSDNNYRCWYDATPPPSSAPELTTQILSMYLAVYNVRQAVLSLMWTQLLPSSDAASEDNYLWNLLLLEREAQLALAEAYHEDKLLLQAFYSLRRACSNYALMPAKLDGTAFVSSMERPEFFWAKSWMLLGDLLFLSFKEPEGELKLQLAEGLGCVVGNVKIKFSGSTKESTVPGLLKFLKSSISVGVSGNLFDATRCYLECQNALKKLPDCSKYIQTLNERLGRARSEIGDLLCKETKFKNAQVAYSDAILAFNQVPEHKGLVRQLNCKLGVLVKAEAEEWVEKMDEATLCDKKVYYDKAESYYRKSLDYFKKAKAELGASPEEKVSVYKDLADTYLSFGILLAKKETEDADPEQQAGAAIRDAVTLYESDILSKTSKQDVANAYLALAQYMKRCCMRILKTEQKKAIQYASIADSNWRRSMIFYEAETFPDKFLSTLIERSSLSFALPNTKPEDALCILLEGRLIPETEAKDLDFWKPFWAELQKVLLQMLKDAKKTEDVGYIGKLKGLYGSALYPKDLGVLRNIYATWTSS